MTTATFRDEMQRDRAAEDAAYLRYLRARLDRAQVALKSPQPRDVFWTLRDDVQHYTKLIGMMEPTE